jgi:CO dehydrogenase maturation factor
MNDAHPDILAIDADPDLNLPQVLGLDFSKTVGEVRDVLLKGLSDMTPQIGDKSVQFESAIMEVIEETDPCDLLVMGQPEKMGCYCPVNNMIRMVIDTISSNYDYTIIDCEPGLEHISRRTTRGVNTMLVVTDATVKGLQCADRIKKLVKKIENVEIKKVLTLANRVPAGMEAKMIDNAKEYDIDLVEIIPFDPLVTQYDIENKPVWDLPYDSPVVIGVQNFIEKVLKK